MGDAAVHGGDGDVQDPPAPGLADDLDLSSGTLQASEYEQRVGSHTMTQPPGDEAFQRSALTAVQDFAEAAFAAQTVPELETAVASACAQLGFDYFAIVHHVDFGRVTPNAVRLTNYPEQFIAKAREGQMGRDPVMRASERTNSGFTWSEVANLIPLTERDRAYMRQAGELGLAEGFTVPYHIPGETLGSCHFAVREHGRLPVANLPAAQSIGAFGFEAARRLFATDDYRHIAARRLPLTRRQRDCVIEVARGKSDTVIAQLLGLRPRTVNE
jgi:hypothetical protein